MTERLGQDLLPIHYDDSIPFETGVVAGSLDKEGIEEATLSYCRVLGNFLFSGDEGVIYDVDFGKVSKLKEYWLQHAEQAQRLIADIIEGINERARVKNGREYELLVERDRAQWIGDRYYIKAEELKTGFRGCVDGGLAQEAIAGFDPFGRSLAGDDEMMVSDRYKRWSLGENAVKKILIDWVNQGGTNLLGLIEHLGCGRRDQMKKNLQAGNEISRLFNEVMSNISYLESEFEGEDGQIQEALRKMDEMWEETDEGGIKKMVSDNGVWVGILTKIAQRQAYRGTRDLERTIIPVELYDKRNGNVFVGIDDHSVLTHKLVSENGGYTDEVLEKLVDEKLVFSLEHEVSKLEEWLSEDDRLSVKKGERTFENLQEDWLSTREKFTDVTGKLWDLFESESEDDNVQSFKAMVNRFIKMSFQNVVHDFDAIDPGVGEVLMRRQTHHLFQMLAYAWTLDTFGEKGNPPGKGHLESYGVTREVELGVRKQMGLASGEIYKINSDGIYTTRQVLLGSDNVAKDEPVVYISQLDTDRGDAVPVSGTEGAALRGDIEELLKLWPYIVIGDIVPVIQIISKAYDGVSKLALSAILEFESLFLYAERIGGLPELVPAATPSGEVVLVPAMEVIDLGLKANGDLAQFRRELPLLAEGVSNKAIQKRLR